MAPGGSHARGTLDDRPALSSHVEDTFSDLKLNNKTPSIVKNDADVLLPSHASAEVPTKVVHDAFTFYSPVGYQRQYFADDRI